MNTLYYGDNLQILRDHIKDESIDLIYLDPPFNSQAIYNILYKEPTGKLSDAPGVSYQDIWAYQPGTEGCVYGNDLIGIDHDIKWLSTKDKERFGYPTQKPEGLLARIINTTSKKDDIVLDPFCGCGTTIVVAQNLKRKWIGTDITHLAINLIKRCMRGMFNVKPKVVGRPVDLEGAKDLAKINRYQFQWWALDLIDATPYEGKKKGKDTGIDGYIYFNVGTN